MKHVELQDKYDRLVDAVVNLALHKVRVELHTMSGEQSNGLEADTDWVEVHMKGCGMIVCNDGNVVDAILEADHYLRKKADNV